MSGPARSRVRVVVTGMGAVTPFGWGIEAFERGLRGGRTAIRELTVLSPERQRTRLAGEVPHHADAWLADLPAPARRRLTRTESFALSAAREAVAMANVHLAGTGAGVFFGSNTGGMLEGERLYRAQRSGVPRVRPGAMASHQYNCAADTVGRHFDVDGPVMTMTTACSASGMAIESALQCIRSGEVDVALAGGTDALCELTYSGFNSLRVIDPEPCLPFRAGRSGLSLGEGAGVLVLESLEHAKVRGAEVLAELAGAGSSCDAYHMTAPQPDGGGLQRAIERALADAGVEPDDVDLVNAHGTGTPHNDAAEWQGLRRVFGERAGALPVLATKGAIGHLLGACGAVEAVATLLAMRARAWFPTPGPRSVDPGCPVSICSAEQALPRARLALSINLAFGGANAALVLREFEPDGAAPAADAGSTP